MITVRMSQEQHAELCQRVIETGLSMEGVVMRALFGGRYEPVRGKKRGRKLRPSAAKPSSIGPNSIGHCGVEQQVSSPGS